MAEVANNFNPSENSDASQNFDASENFDAQLVKEEIAAGEMKAPQVDVSADYEASKQFSVSEIDRTGEGAQAAAAATAPKFELPKPEEPTHEAPVTGNPQDYLEMAKEVSSTPNAPGNVSDDLVEKALEMGQPAQ